jgi:hypothetical protein
MLVKFNLHRAGYVVAEFSPLIINETFYTHGPPSLTGSYFGIERTKSFLSLFWVVSTQNLIFELAEKLNDGIVDK